MCVVVIVDADSFPVLVSRHGTGDSAFLSWIRSRHGILAISNSGQYFKELKKNIAVMDLIRRYDQGGQLRKIPANLLTTSDKEIAQKQHQSNDPHILSLALASDAQVLCSNDLKLRADFKNKQVLPPTGRGSRTLYPFAGSHKTRRKFLSRQRCSNR